MSFKFFFLHIFFFFYLQKFKYKRIFSLLLLLLLNKLFQQQFPPAGVHRLQSKASAASYLSKVECTFTFHVYKCVIRPFKRYSSQHFSTCITLSLFPFQSTLFHAKCDKKSHIVQNSNVKSTHIDLHRNFPL